VGAVSKLSRQVSYGLSVIVVLPLRCAVYVRLASASDEQPRETGEPR